jgi:hypothetical protein
MNPRSVPVPGETLASAGHRIRDAAPIHGDRATDAECALRRDLIDDTITTRDVHPGPHVWHTAQLVDGHVTGVWANSVAEAELELTVWWGCACHWVRPDGDTRLLQEYFPRGKRTAAAADKRFPLGPPRRARDRFAPASSLLDDIWARTDDNNSIAR